jgi:2-oxoglutarate dehydrogenase E1 component
VDSSFANLSNLPGLEDLYQAYLKDPTSVDSSWRYFFDGMHFGTLAAPRAGKIEGASDDLRIYYLIQAYRTYGHLKVSCNPIATETPQEPPELNLKTLGFKEEELGTLFPTCGFLKTPKAPLQEIVGALNKTYCSGIGAEYMDLGEPNLEQWLQQRIEPFFPLNLSAEEKTRLLEFLNKAELFESFIHTKYTGQKRFSLEGGETLIPMLATILDRGAEEGVTEVVLGMAHRGRLNVLANILNKPYGLIFNEFEDHYAPDEFEGTGDVKYHKGFKGSLPTASGKMIDITLAANPSHLEAVNPVVEGQSRAKQELKHNPEGKKAVVPILIHGDAAIAGQGVVYETLQLMRLKGYSTGGTLHLIVNNQIGFTTLPKDSRSTRYCTDIAKAFGAPVFHVNAEDPESCVAVAKIAIELRQRFGCDVFIDLNCYRKYGHNESDEPAFTQPLEYQLIRAKKSIRELYKNKLIQEGVLNQATVDALESTFKANLQESLKTTQDKPSPNQEGKNLSSSPSTPSAETLIALSKTFCTVPEGFHIHPKIQRLLQDRLKMVTENRETASIDWGMGEHLAFATLVNEGYHVRLSGQDCRRGTFSHRHAMWVDQMNETKYFPLSHIKEGQGLFDVFNSSLSEYAVMGFEFGYSLEYPKSLVIWEAQFGDFANTAQVVIDQFIASSEQKWMLSSNLTLLLPHGYEGQGPEHSSARMERFLQLCGHDNMRIANCTTPAQLYHLLRKQAILANKKPLIVFTPKGLLRHPECVSKLADFASGSFQEVLDDPQGPSKPKKLILCSGRIYYDLIAERKQRNAGDLAIVRVEQLYPYPEHKMKEILAKYKGAETVIWAQEEHANKGAWEYIHPLIEKDLGKTVKYVGRDRSAAASAGSYALHKKQYAALIQEVFS